jgi:hypothetical protein
LGGRLKPGLKKLAAGDGPHNKSGRVHLYKVDKFGGTKLDAAVNLILLDGYFDKEQFQRDKFNAPIGAGK